MVKSLQKRVFQQPAIRALMLKILFGKKGQQCLQSTERGILKPQGATT
jgi:hypothetical protein